jgi:hypothetical protein
MIQYSLKTLWQSCVQMCVGGNIGLISLFLPLVRNIAAVHLFFIMSTWRVSPLHVDFIPVQNWGVIFRICPRCLSLLLLELVPIPLQVPSAPLCCTCCPRLTLHSVAVLAWASPRAKHSQPASIAQSWFGFVLVVPLRLDGSGRKYIKPKGKVVGKFRDN